MVLFLNYFRENEVQALYFKANAFEEPELEYSFTNSTLKRVNGVCLYDYEFPQRPGNSHSLVCFERKE